MSKTVKKSYVDDDVLKGLKQYVPKHIQNTINDLAIIPGRVDCYEDFNCHRCGEKLVLFEEDEHELDWEVNGKFDCIFRITYEEEVAACTHCKLIYLPCEKCAGKINPKYPKEIKDVQLCRFIGCNTIGDFYQYMPDDSDDELDRSKICIPYRPNCSKKQFLEYLYYVFKFNVGKNKVFYDKGSKTKKKKGYEDPKLKDEKVRWEMVINDPLLFVPRELDFGWRTREEIYSDIGTVPDCVVQAFESNLFDDVLKERQIEFVPEDKMEQCRKDTKGCDSQSMDHYAGDLNNYYLDNRLVLAPTGSDGGTGVNWYCDRCQEYVSVTDK